jgi:hypothetical protein
VVDFISSLTSASHCRAPRLMRAELSSNSNGLLQLDPRHPFWQYPDPEADADGVDVRIADDDFRPLSPMRPLELPMLSNRTSSQPNLRISA